jgi:hypothetical protein
MDKFIVITTIHGITDAVEKWCGQEGWRVVLVGDTKTPHIPVGNYTYLPHLPNANTLYMPSNHYARKNLGYMWAMRNGATIIYDTDDDTFPHIVWGAYHAPEYTHIQGDDLFYNIYDWYGCKSIWPRGFPLNRIQEPQKGWECTLVSLPSIIQGLVNRSPDVDAIWRLTHDEEVMFAEKGVTVLDHHTYCPFNSQATLWKQEAFPLMYLPITVNPRFTDILRGYVAQRCLWSMDRYLAFDQPTTYQIRNPHNLMQDFADEVEMYLSVEKVVAELEKLQLPSDPKEALIRAYDKLYDIGVVKAEELPSVRAWVRDLPKTT